jgi:anti-anti-sigma factor
MNSQPTKSDFTVTFLNETVIVQIPARLSVIEALSFKQTCQELIQANRVLKQIIIAFDNTIFMDSTGLGALVSNFKNAQEQGIEMKLRNVTPQVFTVLSLTGLDRVFPMESYENYENS